MIKWTGHTFPIRRDLKQLLIARLIEDLLSEAAERGCLGWWFYQHSSPEEFISEAILFRGEIKDGIKQSIA